MRNSESRTVWSRLSFAATDPAPKAALLGADGQPDTERIADVLAPSLRLGTVGRPGTVGTVTRWSHGAGSCSRRASTLPSSISSLSVNVDSQHSCNPARWTGAALRSRASPASLSTV